MLFQNITGKKETKGFTEPVVIVCPTPGEFRLTPLVQKQLDIKDGDFGLIVLDPNDSSKVYIAKGVAGIPVRDEEGNLIKDGRGRYTYEEGSGFGATLRTASEGSLNLKLTGAAGWNAVGGNTEQNQLFLLGEGVEGAVPTGAKDAAGEDVLHSTVFYPLVFKSAKQKAVRVASAGADVSQVEGPYEEPEVDAEEFENEEV